MKPTQQPTETDYIKMAVIIDCEGNIAIKHAVRNRHHALHLTVGNTDFALPEWCLARFGGGMYAIFYKKKPGPEYATPKRWMITGHEASEVLIKCLPHFIMKQKQAEIAIRFQATYKNSRKRINESDRLLREELRQELQALTKRGPKSVPQEIIKAPIKPAPQGNLFAKDFSN